MGVFEFIFGKPIKVENYFFGEMLFVEIRQDSSKSYFECRRHFQPSNDIIEIGLDGDVTGPTQVQIDFFKNIERIYAKISDSVIPLMEERFRGWKKDFRIIDFTKEFTPVYLKIPRCITKPIVWEIAFESIHDANHIFTLTMEEIRATELSMDG